MGKYNGAVITTAGQNLIAQAIAESKTVTFTTAQASSHVYPSSTDFEALTALTDVEKTVDINYAGVYSDTVVQVSARFDNTGVDTAYLINTLGFFAQLDTDTPILFAVSTAVTPDQMPVFDADNPSAFIYNMQITVQNANSINVSVNPAGTVTVDQLNTAVSALQTQINAKVDISSVIDNLGQSIYVSGRVLSAHQGRVLGMLIAPIELQFKASIEYVTGANFIYDGNIYVATSPVSIGDVFVVGGNCELFGSITSQLRSMREVNTSLFSADSFTNFTMTSGSETYNNWQKNGKIVTLSFDGKKNNSNSDVIITLPQYLRPKYNLRYTIRPYSATQSWVNDYIQISTNGTVIVPTLERIMTQVTYIVE